MPRTFGESGFPFSARCSRSTRPRGRPHRPKNGEAIDQEHAPSDARPPAAESNRRQHVETGIIGGLTLGGLAASPTAQHVHHSREPDYLRRTPPYRASLRGPRRFANSTTPNAVTWACRSRQPAAPAQGHEPSASTAGPQGEGESINVDEPWAIKRPTRGRRVRCSSRPPRRPRAQRLTLILMNAGMPSSRHLVIRTGSDSNPTDKSGARQIRAAMIDEGTPRATPALADETARRGGRWTTGSSRTRRRYRETLSKNSPRRSTGRGCPLRPSFPPPR